MSQLYLRQEDDSALCRCGNCAHTCTADEVEIITDFEERVSSGEVCPAGECPECGCLMYLDEPEKPTASPDAIAALKALLEWESYMGGFDAPAWQAARAAVASHAGAGDVSIASAPAFERHKARPGLRFLVIWEIDSDAATPAAAARKAWAQMRAPDSTANCFTVIDAAGHATEIDLSPEGEQFAHLPEFCPSSHWNRGDDICADCGTDLNAA